MKKWHYLRGNKARRVPNKILFYDTETRWKEKGDITIHTAYIIESCLCTCVDRDTLEYSEKWKSHNDSESFWKYVIQNIRNKETLYIIGSNVLFDIAATRGFTILPEYGFTHNFDATSGMTFILSLRNKSRGIKFLSCQNMVKYGVEKLGRLLGYEKGKVDFENDPPEKIRAYCKRDVEIVKKAVLKYMQFCSENDLGNFALTLSSQALNAYRHRFMNEKILIHDSEYANKLEREAYYGGRTECFYIGEVKADTVFSMDINSMYPYVMRQHRYPTVYKNYLKNPDLDYVKNQLRTRCIIAECDLDTDVPLYATRLNGKTCFPVGTFTTCLCTRGLETALKSGHIKVVRQAVEYESGSIFQDYVKYFYALKKRYKASQNTFWYEIVKLFLNSLYGKFGQQYARIVVEKECCIDKLERNYCYDLDTGEHFIEQYLCGKYKRIQGKEDSMVTFAGIAAHVTEYARFYLWSIIESIGPENVLYCDTDSVFIPEDIVSEIPGYLKGDKLGQLSVEKEMNGLTIHGCKDYEYENVKVLKGIRKDAVQISPSEYEQGIWLSLNGLLREGIREGYGVKKQVKKLKREYDKGRVLETGRVEPLILNGLS